MCIRDRKSSLTYIHSESETNRQTHAYIQREGERVVVKQRTTYNESCNVSPVINVTHAIHRRVTERQTYEHQTAGPTASHNASLDCCPVSLAKLNDGCACRIFAPSVYVNREK